MDITTFEKYTFLELNTRSDFKSLLDFLYKKKINPPHVIINLLKINISNQMIVEKLFPMYLNWEKRNKSFILVSNISENLLQGLISINSVDEAVDFFYMDELTRNIKL